ncbi:hypothetical protein [Thermogymnomonas acidicola]|uniref:hypothetical protein n=1 Tax=Thermogymnomonas acidicola TaxID=399579 RepID=UPI001E43D680|nr:hypothetical protein [Thermogymnomonas acidicola]
MESVSVKSAYEREELLNGCQAVSHAVRLADVDVVAAYPIRPYTEVMDQISKFIADGEFYAEYIIADGEHSQFEIGKHAVSVGARAFVGSSGTGWMYATEALVATATDRLPLVAMCGNRALDDPGAFGVEHNDALMLRDVGWNLVWVDTAQQALDTTLLAYRIAEDPAVMMPTAVSLDGAFLTHSQHMVKIPTKEAVDQFLPPYNPKVKLDPDNPVSIAPQANEDWVMEIRRQNYEAGKRAKGVIYRAYREFNEIFGTHYENPFFEEFMTADADFVLIGMGSIAMPAKAAVKEMRRKGVKAGYISLHWLRPFPTEELRKALSRFRGIGVIDRDFAIGTPDLGGVLFHEIRSCMYRSSSRPNILNFISGLGARDTSIEDCMRMIDIVSHAKGDETEQVVTWIGVRE